MFTVCQRHSSSIGSTRFSYCLIAVAVMLFPILANGASAQTPVDRSIAFSGDAGLSSRLPRAGLFEQAKQVLNLSNVSLQTIDITAADGSPFETTVDIDGISYRLDLQPHSMRSAGFQLMVSGEGGTHPVPAPDSKTYRGVVRTMNGDEILGSSVAASMRDGKLTALINLNDGDAWFVQPLDRAGLPPGDGNHAVYRRDETIPTNHQCGFNELMGGIPYEDQGSGGSQSGAPRATTFKVADIAIDADFPFFQLNGSNLASTLFDIENIMNTVEFIYERDTDITYEITAIVVRTSSAADPYTTSNSSALLDEFRAEWIANFGGIPRDIAHLFTGRNLNGGIIGIAFLSQICAPFSGLGYGLSQSRFTANINSRVSLTAHELGHNWSATHCDGNGDCHIMCSVIALCNGLGTPNFGNLAISQIVSHRNSRTCLFPSSGTLADPVILPLSDTFPSSTIDTAKWIFNDQALVNSNAVNAPSPALSLNLDSSGAGTYDQNELRSNFILLGAESAVSIEYHTEHIGVENGESLVVEYWGSNLSWIHLNTITSDGTDQTAFTIHNHLLLPSTDPNAFHNEFRLRFRTLGSDSTDDWYIDNVQVATSLADITPPLPNPMTFAVDPAPALPPDDPATQFSMVATTATDADSPPVEYFFEHLFGNSGWQPSSSFLATVPLSNFIYQWTVKARDSSPQLNETQPSAPVVTVTHIETPTGISFANVDATSLDVTALGTLSFLDVDQSGLFFEMTPAVAGSGTNVWTVNDLNTTLTVTGLSFNTQYDFRVKARNRLGVETPFTALFSVTTADVTAPGAPILSNPTETTMDLDIDTNSNPPTTQYAIQCLSTSPLDPAWDGQFANHGTGNPQALEDWQVAGGTIVLGNLQPGTTYEFHVKSRNPLLFETGFGPSSSLATATIQAPGAPTLTATGADTMDLT
ncbi:MAG: M12 family metallo-peptidase, partial [Phycisphaerae bacterium]